MLFYAAVCDASFLLLQIPHHYSIAAFNTDKLLYELV